MTSTPDTIRVFIPLTIRRRNGRPRILPPADMEAAEPRSQRTVFYSTGRHLAYLRLEPNLSCCFGNHPELES